MNIPPRSILRLRQDVQNAAEPNSNPQRLTEMPVKPQSSADVAAREVAAGKSLANKLLLQAERLKVDSRLKRNIATETKGGGEAVPKAKQTRLDDIGAIQPAEDRARPTRAPAAATWSGTAPIRPLTTNEAVSALKTFKNNLMAWDPEFSPIVWDDESESSTKPWSNRLRETYPIITYLESMLEKNCALPSTCDDASTHAYYVNGEPVGMMLLEELPINPLDPPSVDALVTHPSYRGAGGALIELAVNTSEMTGKSGRLILSAANDNARQIYEAFGFTDLGETMILDPAGNEKWHQQDDGTWKLEKYKDKQYLAGFGRQEQA